MKLIILILLPFSLCFFIKRKWLVFLIGVFFYSVISFIIEASTAELGSQLNFTLENVLNFIGFKIGEFLIGYLIGLVLFYIFKKSKKDSNKINNVSSTSDIVFIETNDNKHLKIISKLNEKIGADVFINDLPAPDGVYNYNMMYPICRTDIVNN